MRQFVTFRLGDQLFGVDVLLVREVNQMLEITPVQQAPDYVRGLINLRGQIVTIFDLGVRLGLEPRTITATTHNVILKTNDELGLARSREKRDDLKTSADTVGLLVDSNGDVVEAQENDIEPPPANIDGIDGRFFTGVVKLDGDLLVVLNATELLQEETRDMEGFGQTE